MRVGRDSDGNFDYHFWYRANNGLWYNKHGWSDTSEQCISNVMNPAAATTDCPGWKKDGVGFYSSDTVFYAVHE